MAHCPATTLLRENCSIPRLVHLLIRAFLDTQGLGTLTVSVVKIGLSIFKYFFSFQSVSGTSNSQAAGSYADGVRMEEIVERTVGALHILAREGHNRAVSKYCEHKLSEKCCEPL